MFLKLRLGASKREMVVWLKSFPYSFPMAKPTSPWRREEGQGGGRKERHDLDGWRGEEMEREQDQ